MTYNLYKFKKIDLHLIESLATNSIYCAPPKDLNDPFDCQLDLECAYARAERMAVGSRVDWIRNSIKTNNLPELQEQLQSIGIYSSSNATENVILNKALWSHYADNHRGVCLKFAIEKEFISKNSDKINGISNVIYSDDYLANWIAEYKGDREKFAENLIIKYWIIKSIEWSYECEVRIISVDKGPIVLPRGSLTQVCFGMGTTDENISLIKKIAIDYSGCMKFSRMVHDGESDFGLKNIPLE